MSIDLLVLAALAVAGIVGSVLVVARDGYQRIPTRRS
jgi:hypothetical protein